jgi:hypothetical protein
MITGCPVHDVRMGQPTYSMSVSAACSGAAADMGSGRVSGAIYYIMEVA